MNYEEKYNEILEWARKNKARLNGVPIEEVLPELAESEDERIKKTIRQLLETARDAHSNTSLAKPFIDALAWLKKQKEDKDELVYRLNWLMQDYIKEGKDDEEKEHRFRCYQLFWDALEDTNFFEQKEQKPVESIFTGLTEFEQCMLDFAKARDEYEFDSTKVVELNNKVIELTKSYSKKLLALAKKEMPLPEDTVIFQKGVEEGRRLERDEMKWKFYGNTEPVPTVNGPLCLRYGGICSNPMRDCINCNTVGPVKFNTNTSSGTSTLKAEG